MMDYSIKKPNPDEKYKFSFTISEEERQASARREARAAELGIRLYILEDTNEEKEELRELEDYILDNFIDLDLDVPDGIKEKYLNLKKKLEEEQNK